MRARSLALTLAFAASLAAGCNEPAAAPGDAAPAADRIPVTIHTEGGPVVFQAEVADTPAERSRGLMYREQMGKQDGMLFLFPDERPNSFWMRNTLIPLDMIFIRADRTILGIVENAEPRTDTPRAVPGLSQFVLEINGGLSRKLGIEAGQTVTFMAPIPSQ